MVPSSLNLATTRFRHYSNSSFKKPTLITPYNNVIIHSALQSTPFIDFPKSPSPQPLITTKPNNHQTQWNPIQKLASIALNAAESFLLSHELQHPLPKTSDPNVQLAGNFSPVPESPVHHSLPISGTIPSSISGVYLRNGANPFFHPTSGHHLFDGDCMVHAVHLHNGAASYACRFTQTNRLLQEKTLNRPTFPKAIGQLHGHSGIARLLLFYARAAFRLIDHRHGVGVANAGLIFFNNRLLALSEDDNPYHIHVTPSGDIKTIGRYNFDGQLNSNMIAHPKIDPESGELFALSYDVVSKPYLRYLRFSKDGIMSHDLEIPLDVPTMIHDFAITKNFVVVPDHQVVFKLKEMITGGSPVIYDEKKKSRFGVLSKNASKGSEVVWIECPDTFCFHLWNAWEEPESDEIVVIGSCMSPPDSIFNDKDEKLRSVLSEIRLNMKTGESIKRAIIQEELNLEAGTVNRGRLGRKTRFAYLSITEPWPKVSGFAKVDLESGEVKKYMYGEDRYGGEPFFMEKNSDGDEDEDEGFVMSFVHDEKNGKSELQIVNAVEMKVEAIVKIPTRVPYGFHGTFVDAKDLANQA